MLYLFSNSMVAFLFLPRSFVSSAQVTSILSRYVNMWPWFILSLGDLGEDQVDMTSLVSGYCVGPSAAQ